MVGGAMVISLSMIWLLSCSQNTGTRSAVIIKAAGYLPGTEAPEGPDAITSATSEGNNTHTFAEKLQEKLQAQKIAVRIVDYTDARGQTFVENLVIFAGPTYSGKLIKQILNLVEEITIGPKSVCTCLTACGTPSSGDEAAELMNQHLTESGLKTIPGIAIGVKIEAEVIDKALDGFANKLVVALK